jgi:hypothetical protein
MQSFRPRGSTGPMYSPERDLAYIGPTVLRAGIDSLEQVLKSDEIQAMLSLHGCDNSHVAAAVTAYAESQSLFVGTPDVMTTGQALQAGGFVNHPLIAQQLVLAAIGASLTGAWFKAVRDTTHVGEVPEGEGDMFRFYQAAREVVAKLDGLPPPQVIPPTAVEFHTMTRQLQELRNHHGAVLQTLTDLRTTYASTQHRLDEAHRRLEEKIVALGEVHAWRSQVESTWSYRLGTGLKNFWNKLMQRKR